MAEAKTSGMEEWKVHLMRTSEPKVKHAEKGFIFLTSEKK